MARFGMFGRRVVADWVEREGAAVGETILSVGADALTVWAGWPVRPYLINRLVRMWPRTLGQRNEELTKWSLEELVEHLRHPPEPPQTPRLIRNRLRGLDLFILHEDIRRAQPGWEPRSLSPDDQFALGFCLQSVRVHPPRELKAAGIPVLLEPAVESPVPGAPPFPQTGALRGPEPVTLSGPAGELVLYCYARGAFARDVSLDGPPEKIEALRSALCV